MMRGVGAVLALAVILGIIALGVAQVPQPWRALLVVWALAVLPVILAGLRVLRQVLDYRRAKMDALERQGGRILAHRPPAEPPARPAGLRVVRQEEQVGSGRHTIR